ncbi:MAG: phosphonate ABC transporter, permease protein PhnE [Pseudomonadota bacterium]
MTAVAEHQGLPTLQADVDRAAGRNRLWFLGVTAVIFAYLVLSWFQFDIGSVVQKWKPDRAALFVLDTYAHKDHVTMRWKSPDKIKIAFEGGHREVYETPPDWFTQGPDGGRVISFDNGGTITFFDDKVTMDWPGRDETFTFRVDGKTPIVEGYPRRPWVDRAVVNERLATGGWFPELPSDLRPDHNGKITKDEWAELTRALAAAGLDQPAGLPEWIRVTKNKVEVRPSLFERLQIGTLKAEVHRYEVGWKYFWFDFDSPLVGTGFLGGIGLMLSGDRMVPEMSNTMLVWTEFRDNAIWQHGTVLYAMLETIFMALLGTMIASAIGLPLAFMAARNVQPVMAIRFALRRLFDLLRGIDTLIWSLIFLRAFGPGLFTGIFAIAFTDTGTLGKLMSEAVENADNKQREGVQSTGAGKVQQHRFGILPQIMPVFISQSLYYLESNTRSAVIIGAMGAGGIGLQFLGALQTGNDFENVAYMALLVLVTVIAMDAMSARLRSILIGIDKRSD